MPQCTAIVPVFNRTIRIFSEVLEVADMIIDSYKSAKAAHAATCSTAKACSIAVPTKDAELRARVVR